jgi:hypothetical protein
MCVYPCLHTCIYPCMPVFIHAYVYMCVHSIDQKVAKITAECGISYKHTVCMKYEKYTALLHDRYCKDFIYIVMDHLDIKIHQQGKKSVCLSIFEQYCKLCLFTYKTCDVKQ